jgi:hypothetical protein
MYYQAVTDVRLPGRCAVIQILVKANGSGTIDG